MDRINHISCPACSGKLSKVLIGNVFLDICQGGCAGIWFDKGELEKTEACKSQVDKLFHIQKNIDVDTSQERICPVCKNIKLTKHIVKGNSYAEIDECKQCGGIWLDAGELDAFMKNDHPADERRGQELKNYLAGIYQTDNLNKVISMHNFVNTNLALGKIPPQNIEDSKANENSGNNQDLICPACLKHLTRIQVVDMDVDICKGGCAGIWFDKGELEKVDEEHEAAGKILLNIEKDETLSIDTSKTRKCPRCPGSNMTKHFSSVKRMVEVDECEECGGTWLDANELERIWSEFKDKAEKNEAEKQYFQKYDSGIIDYMIEKDKSKMDKFFDGVFKRLHHEKK